MKLALPAVGEMVLYMMIWVLDTLMIGNHTGQIGVSAVGLSSEIMYTFTNMLVAMGISISVTSIVSRSIGSRDFEKARITSDIALKIGVIIAILLGTIFFTFPKEILTIAKALKQSMFFL